MFVEFLTDPEGMMQFSHQGFLFECECAGMLGINRREVTARQRILLPVKQYRTFFVVYHLEKFTILHFPLGMSFKELSFFLELYDGNSLMHLGCQAECFLIHLLCSATETRHELLTGIVLVDFHGECS